jgi:hypothetical protein
MDEGVQLLELARNAQKLFERQEPREKRRLLNFVLSNCTWEDGEVSLTSADHLICWQKPRQSRGSQQPMRRQNRQKLRYGWHVGLELANVEMACAKRVGPSTRDHRSSRPGSTMPTGPPYCRHRLRSGKNR